MLLVSSLGGGGAERVIVELASFLCDCGHRVTLATLTGDGEDAYELDPRVQRLRSNIMWDSASFVQRIVNTVRRLAIVRRAVRSAQPDVVISFIDMTNIRALGALIGTGIPVIVSERTDPRHHKIGRAWEMLRVLTYPLAARVVVQTEGVRAWAQRAMARARVVVVPNAVRAFAATDAARPAAMPEGKVVVAMGRLSHEKGFDLLLDAFARAQLADRGWSLVILGEGPNRQALTEQAGRLGIAAHVSLPGRTRDPEAWLRHADIFTLSSRYEGFPNVLVEAMQCGAASVAFACDSGPSAIVRDGVDGLLVPDGDVQALASALARLADDAQLRARLSACAPSVVERFSREAVYRQWQTLCEDVMAGRGRFRSPG
jgi:glycosyltransferase involved in cell wall biosynthesis